MFKVPNRPGMGVHSGRKDSCDAAERCGYKHATLGCIRTTDDAMKEIKDLHDGGDTLTSIEVK